MKKLTFAVLAAFLATAALAQSPVNQGSGSPTVYPWRMQGSAATTAIPMATASKGVLLYDSGSVAAGALIDSGVLDLTFYTSLEVVIDNTAGTAVRQLTMASFLADGVTQIDTVPLRVVAFGTAPTGSVYAPGRVRGYLGPNPPGGTSGKYLLYQATSADNGALDSGNVWAYDFDSVLADAAVASGTVTGVFAATIRYDDGTVPGFGAWTTAQNIANAQNHSSYVYGLGAADEAGFLTGYGASPPVVRFTTSPAGAGATVRLAVWGIGRLPGTFAVNVLLPLRAQFTLAAAGAGAARIVIIGR